MISPSVADKPDWHDFTLETKITLVRDAVGILFRARDDRNLYMWQFNTVIGPTLMLRPHILKNGQWSMLPAVSLRDAVPESAEHAPHLLKIEARGSRIRTYLDDKLVDERTDETFAVRHHRFSRLERRARHGGRSQDHRSRRENLVPR